MDIKLINNNSLNFDPFIQLDHITSHSNEYIDTGVLPTDNIKLEMEFSFNSVSGCPYGTQTTGYTTQSFQLVPYSGSIYYMITLTQGTTTHPTLYTNKRYHVEHKKGIQKLYDTADSSTLLINETKGSGAFSSSKSIYLFAKNSNSGVSGKSSINLYWCKIYNGDTLIRDYVPSYDNYKYCLFDKVTKEYYHNLGESNFTTNTNLGGSGLSQKITTLFVKDCPETDCLDVLRRITIAQTGIQTKLTRVRCNIGNVSGTLEELQHYATLSGYSDNYEEQTKPRIIGTFTVNSYYTTAELEALDGLIDGLTIVSDSDYNIDYLVSNGEFAIQTFDENADNYNPAVAIKLNNLGIGSIHGNPITENGGKYFLTKEEAASVSSITTTWFKDFLSITDTDKIVSNDDTQSYDFETFDEFKYFTGLTTIPTGSGSNGSFYGCTNLTSIEIPEGITTINTVAFHNCSSLHRIVLPSTLTGTTQNSFTGLTSMNGGSVYYNGTLKQWMSISFSNGNVRGRYANPTWPGAHLYLQGEELTSLTIPLDVTSIKLETFIGCKYIAGNVIIPDNITTIAMEAFDSCSGLTSIEIPNTVTSISSYAFNNCSGLTGQLVIPSSVTSIGDAAFSNCTNINVIKCNSIISVSSSAFSGTHEEGSAFITKGSLSSPSGFIPNLGWSVILIHGNVTMSSRPFNSSNKTKILRIKGDYTGSTSNTGLSYLASGGIQLEFIEVMGNVGTARFVYNNTNINTGTTRRSNGDYWHFGSSSVIPADRLNGVAAHWNKTNMVWVGDGSSRANDEAVLALYLADSTWSAQSAKLGTWYDYNGEYKWYYVTDNLTNCTNTNPDEWPHITRGESYQTTIVPDEGMTINSLTVEMLDTDTTSPTYDTYIPQPTSYDSATGIYTISIPSVTGNVVITASAS